MTKLSLDKNIYHQDLTTKKCDYSVISLNPATASNLNKNGNLTFNLLQTANALNLSEAILVFEIEILDIKADENVTLQNNFFPYLFSNALLKLGSTEVETIQYLGASNSLTNFVMMSKNNDGEIFGWIPDKIKEDENKDNKGYKRRKLLYSNNKFTGDFPLKLMFGFLQYYKRVIYNMQGELTFTRRIDIDKEIFYGTKGDGKIKLIDLKLLIPELQLNPSAELELLSRIDDGKSINVNFLSRICEERNLTEGSTQSLQLYNIPNKPIYLFIGFRESEFDFTKNNSLFIQQKIKSLRVQLNSSSYYPLNPIQFEKGKNNRTYSNYVKACKYFNNSGIATESYSSEPQLSLLEFQNLYSIFCFDLKDQPENLCLNGAVVNLEILKDADFKGKINVVLLQEQFMELKLKSGKMINIETRIKESLKH